ncbi:U-box domain-containing protein 5-like isoform X2 [Malania oleifera]|uniref:U-box domain-containing protein 5-like isoform X2 n=1 Tax=Malania oleifera TaxID=397392 RepID=UPI0025ADAC7A|nr:U-box domain-containing protein 5-like isoform X2 [Malania oleifera]
MGAGIHIIRKRRKNVGKKAITADRMVLRCEKARNVIESCLTQIQNLVPPPLAARVSGIVDDLRHARFTVEPAEDEAGKVVLALLRQDTPASSSTNNSELEALQFSALRLNITNHIALLIEKRSIKRLHDKARDTETTKKKILRYLLYLLRKYGKTICGRQSESNLALCEESPNQSFESESHGRNDDREQVDDSCSPTPPEEFKCPISMRLMHDPVIIASGQTFERVCIEKWFNEGNDSCPVTHIKVPHTSLTPNCGMKDLISKWCLRHGLAISDPSPQPIPGLRISREASSSCSVVSFGSSMNELRLQISNVSLRSSDTNCGSHTLDVKIDDGCSYIPPQMIANTCRSDSSTDNHGVNLAFLSTLPWEDQCKAVGDIKNNLKDNEKARFLKFSSSYIKPLIKFLKNAQDLCEPKSQRDGAKVLLAVLLESRNEVPPLHEDAIYVLASFIDSEISEEALQIMEVLSRQHFYKTKIVASGVLPSILKVLDSQIRKNHVLAMKILHKLSSSSDIGYHLVYLDCIPKIIPFLSDRILAGYCLEILSNLLNTEEAVVAVAETNICIASIAELLENGTKEQQEHAVDVLLSLCHCCPGYHELAMQENIIQSLASVCVNGNSRGKVVAKELLQLLRDVTNDDVRENQLPNTVLNLDIAQNSASRPKKLKSSSKASKFFRGKINSIFLK